MIIIRRERPEDASAVRRVNEQAFGQRAEADLVDALRQRDELLVSLVAIEDEQVVGHILFSPVTVQSDGASWGAMGLGPMAVLPEHQGKGIGSQLVEVGLEECRKTGHEVVVVLGHPEFYPRFGFAPSKPLGIRWEKDVPEEVFMVTELREGALAERGGVVKYLPEFDRV
jgi:putative acetyltransferase